MTRKMASRNCSGHFNNSESQKICGVNINDQVPLSPTEKVAAFSVVYGVLFLVSVVGKYVNVFTNFCKFLQVSTME